MRYDQIMGLEITLKIGCPNNCLYCPQQLLLSRYQGPKCFTLESFKKCIEGGQVPVSKHCTFMGKGEPFQCPDATKIIRWAMVERGHGGSLSTTLRGCTHEDIEALREMKFTDTIIHVPDAAGQMHIEPDDKWLALFEHAIEAWRHHPDFVISVFGPAHPKVLPTWIKSGIPLVNFGQHDRAGLVPWLKHGDRGAPVPLCGKMFCGSLLPSGDIVRCCSDYGLENRWGNLNQMTYRECYRSQAFRDYMLSLKDPKATPRCRFCMDGYHSINPEDRHKTYENPCPE